MRISFDQIKKLHESSKTKIVLLILDGLGGLPIAPNGLTALESANTPNMDQLAKEGICGLHVPVANGIIPGSGPSHLGLFGFDPLHYQVGRGVLSALGIGFDLQPGDVAARGNFCSIDEQGRVTDRRAGRISTKKNRELLPILDQIDIPGVECILRTVKEYRFLLVLRGSGLSGEIVDTDPQETGEKPLDPSPMNKKAAHTADLVRKFLNQVQRKLSGHMPANMVLLRGFSKKPDWPDFGETFGLKAAAIAAYPMYKGVAKLVGMQTLNGAKSEDDEISILENRWQDFDFFYVHVKKTDSFGEDGDFEKKADLIAQIDKLIPRIQALQPDVLIITGDHSTPCSMKSHSWHPVPVLLWSQFCRSDNVFTFGERACMNGGLGSRFSSTQLIPLALANAGRLKKFGA